MNSPRQSAGVLKDSPSAYIMDYLTRPGTWSLRNAEITREIHGTLRYSKTPHLTSCHP